MIERTVSFSRFGVHPAERVQRAPRWNGIVIDLSSDEDESFREASRRALRLERDALLVSQM